MPQEYKSYINTRGYVIYKTNYDDKLLDELRSELTVHKFDAGGYGNPETDIFPVFIENAAKLYLPVYYGIKKLGQPEVDLRPDGEDINIEFKLKLRDDQIEPVESILKAYKEHGGGILSKRCGGGKTVMGYKLIAEVGKKTLVVVPKNFLLNQWIERAKSCLGDDIVDKLGILTGKKFKTDIEDKYIVFGTIQLLSSKKFPTDTFDSFGHIIFDECHRVSAQCFSRCLHKLNCKNMLGLSATPTRGDGLSKILRFSIGDYMYLNEDEDEIDTDVKVKCYYYHDEDPSYNSVTYMYRLGQQKPNRSRMVTNISNYISRTKVIANLISNVIKNESRRHILVLSDRLMQLRDLEVLLATQHNIESGYYTRQKYNQSTKKFDKQYKQEELDENTEKQVILSTYPMAREGLDIPTLNCLFLVTPVSNVQQACGRILRGDEFDMERVIYDIVDPFSIFIGQCKSRQKYYKKDKFIIEHIDTFYDSHEIKLNTNPFERTKKQTKIESDSDSNDDKTKNKISKYLLELDDKEIKSSKKKIKLKVKKK